MDPISLVEFSQVIFKGDKAIAFPDLISLLLDLRGDNMVTKG